MRSEDEEPPASIDLTPYISDVHFKRPAPDDTVIHGLRTTEVTIEIDFGENGIDRFRCRLCRTSFVIGPEGLATLSHPGLGDIIACPACIIDWTGGR